ncbi:exonuclease YqaJ [Pseudoalteromonas phage B8b]|uniref:Exonuclease YqaJ n=1 Tax=Pseudoalteromonas phage B8b TaxID=1506997 RepID=A0A076G6E8_9CAUD|nr:exonuclease YqaJ [Pseudoalteromonas phage B8b]
MTIVTVSVYLVLLTKQRYTKMKLLDWLFRINRDNAPLVSEQAKSAEAHPITWFF